MSMSKKDYELLARVINKRVRQYHKLSENQTPPGLMDIRYGTLINLVNDLCNELYKDNPNFIPQRFFDKCMDTE